MTGLNSALLLILQTLGGFYLLIVMLRFLLQLVHADFYNPLSQFIVRVTQPPLKILRRLIPGFGGIDLASLVLALLVQVVLLGLSYLLVAGVFPGVANLLVWSAIGLIALISKIFFFVLLASVILSWVAPGNSNPAAQLIHQLCEPFLAPLRKRLPAFGGLDLSPLFAFLLLQLFDMLVLSWLMQATGMPARLSLLL